jgi:hypothetical protein
MGVRFTIEVVVWCGSSALHFVDPDFVDSDSKTA